jgi:hypothetical protein
MAWRRMGSGCINPRIFNLGTSWRWVVSFIPWPFYPWRKSPWYSLDRMLNGRHETEKNHAHTGTRTPNSSAVQPVALSHNKKKSTLTKIPCNFQHLRALSYRYIPRIWRLMECTWVRPVITSLPCCCYTTDCRRLKTTRTTKKQWQIYAFECYPLIFTVFTPRGIS